MSRKPKHTPEDLAKKATYEISEGLGCLSYAELARVESILTANFKAAMPTRKRPAAKVRNVDIDDLTGQP